MSSSLVAQHETWFMPCSESSQIPGQQRLGKPSDLKRAVFGFIKGEPISSMYGIFTYIWLFLMVKCGKCRQIYRQEWGFRKYTIHGCYGEFMIERWAIFLYTYYRFEYVRIFLERREKTCKYTLCIKYICSIMRNWKKLMVKWMKIVCRISSLYDTSTNQCLFLSWSCGRWCWFFFRMRYRLPPWTS